MDGKPTVDHPWPTVDMGCNYMYQHGESSPENESYTEVYAIQPCRKKNLKLRQSILISNDSSGEVELKPNLNKSIEHDHDYIYVKVVCGSTWPSPCGSTATLIIL